MVLTKECAELPLVHAWPRGTYAGLDALCSSLSCACHQPQLPRALHPPAEQAADEKITAGVPVGDICRPLAQDGSPQLPAPIGRRFLMLGFWQGCQGNPMHCLNGSIRLDVSQSPL